jgi:cephalosporin hydroxylase
MTLTETYENLLTELGIEPGGEMVYRFCDKGHNHTYLPFYQRYFQPYQAAASIIEIGVMTGGSLLLWQRWFDSVDSVGIDLREGYNETFAWQQEIQAQHHWSTDTTDATAVPELLTADFVLDDGNHTLEGQWATFQNYWQFVKPGGTYFIEDIESELNAQELRMRIEDQSGADITIEHYRGRVNERADDRILAITRKI